MKGFEKNVICIHEELGGQRNIRQIRDKAIKKQRSENGTLRNTKENGTKEMKKEEKDYIRGLVACDLQGTNRLAREQDGKDRITSVQLKVDHD